MSIISQNNTDEIALSDCIQHWWQRIGFMKIPSNFQRLHIPVNFFRIH